MHEDQVNYVRVKLSVFIYGNTHPNHHVRTRHSVPVSMPACASARSPSPASSALCKDSHPSKEYLLVLGMSKMSMRPWFPGEWRTDRAGQISTPQKLN